MVTKLYKPYQNEIGKIILSTFRLAVQWINNGSYLPVQVAFNPSSKAS